MADNDNEVRTRLARLYGVVELFAVLVFDFAKHAQREIPSDQALGQFQVALGQARCLSELACLGRILAVKSVDKRTRYVLGIDFGTLSGRALMVNADTGEEVAWADHNYKNAVIEESQPGSKKRLKPLTALQHPTDYIQV